MKLVLSVALLCVVSPHVSSGDAGGGEGEGTPPEDTFPCECEAHYANPVITNAGYILTGFTPANGGDGVCTDGHINFEEDPPELTGCIPLPEQDRCDFTATISVKQLGCSGTTGQGPPLTFIVDDVTCGDTELRNIRAFDNCGGGNQINVGFVSFTCRNCEQTVGE